MVIESEDESEENDDDWEDYDISGGISERTNRCKEPNQDETINSARKNLSEKAQM